MRRLSWVIQMGPKRNQKCPYKRKGELIIEEEGYVTTEARTCIAGLEAGGMGP